MSWAEIKKAVNNDISTPLNEQMHDLIVGGFVEFTSPGTYTVNIPDSVIFVTACGGGGSGMLNSSSSQSAGGGGGAAAVLFSKIDNDVEIGTITVVVGKGGKARDGDNPGNGYDGESTVIGDLISLAGGKGGFQGTALAGGPGGGVGGYTSSGGDGIKGIGGALVTGNNNYYGGGGGSLGNGGPGRTIGNYNSSAYVTDAGYGGGSGGMYRSTYGSTSDYAYAGGPGYAAIGWGVLGVIKLFQLWQ